MFGLDADVRYTSGYFIDDGLDPFLYQKGFLLLTAGTRLYDSKGKWELALIGRNLTNRYYLTQANAIALAPPGTYNVALERPREILLQATYHFR
jgi:outer membrane receptor protein involved in Fe transport